MTEHHLQGGCSCGRNQYEIIAPSEDQVRGSTQVLFGDTSEIRRAFGSVLPTLLRVPLPWLQSTTYAYTKDERSTDIKRVFSPRSTPEVKRNFCGFCGIPLTFWTEKRSEDAGFICINLASLERSSLDLLDNLGLLPSADENDDTEVISQSQTQNQPADSSIVDPSNHHRLIRGEPWFEELIQTGPLGRTKLKRGGQVSNDGTSIVEWEIIEVDEEIGETPPKRPNLQ